MSALHDGWTVRATGGGPVPPQIDGLSLPAAVPGCVHTDLMAAGLIGDPYLDATEQDLVWMHTIDWRFSRLLRIDPAAPDEQVDLVFAGIDTVASIRLGDTVLGHTRNMHRGYRFDVRALADGVERDLVVDVVSATTYALAERERLGDRPGPYPTPFNFVRKMACSFGWDWGPDLRTAGIWKPVTLQRWRVARLAEVRPLVDVEPDGTGVVELLLELERSALAPAARDLIVRATVAGVEAHVVVPAATTTSTLTVRVPHASLWWPVGYGDQPLSTVTVSLLDGDDELDRWTSRVGFRTVELCTDDDEFGTEFTLRVNGRAIFAKGANWIPDDHFVSRITRDRLAARLDQALAANLNLLRVWGGGIYESDDFYELADERGLLVWQDFLLACAAYPEEEPLASELAAEARENVVRLMPHPSLVLWNGGNENLWGHEDWGWKEALGERTWGGGYAHELLRDVVHRTDPTRPYSDNSPYSPRRAPADVHPNDPDHGTHHQWEVWNRADYTMYRREIPRFCSEFGFQGPPTWRTLADFVHAEDGGALENTPDPKSDRVWLLHQKAENGNAKLDRGMEPHVGVPAGFVDWLWAAQLVQARAVRHALEHYRSWWPRTAGAIVWQLNDCWPVTSWAAVDSAGRAKPLWFALRRAYAPRLLTVVDRDGSTCVCAVNDTDEPWVGTLQVHRETLDGRLLAQDSVPLAVDPRQVHLHIVAAAVADWDDPVTEVLVATFGDDVVVHTGVEDVQLALDPDPAEYEIERTATGYRLHVHARSLVRDLVVHADRIDPDAVVGDGLVTLTAGGSATIEITCRELTDPAVLLAPPVLRTANDLQRTRTGGPPAAVTGT
jgi:beta-mannosidase